MNVGVTERMNHIADSPALTAAAASVVVIALILCFLVREVARGAGDRYRPFAQDLLIVVVPLFLVGVVIIAARLLALASGG